MISFITFHELCEDSSPMYYGTLPPKKQRIKRKTETQVEHSTIITVFFFTFHGSLLGLSAYGFYSAGLKWCFYIWISFTPPFSDVSSVWKILSLSYMFHVSLSLIYFHLIIYIIIVLYCIRFS